ncbi:hypothetical protein [Anaerocaecibacter muris]|uniref:hypothetical protein n=1 Tax=Anaerocaecibacter muris TaxID=2941513 RepID=UPI00203AC581|nr:hypothetical protein [Anaerocaecibacter muris]
MTEEAKNALYHRCRWCRYFNNGCCTKLSEEFDKPLETIESEIDYALGDGELVEPLREVLEDVRPRFSEELRKNDKKWQDFTDELIANIETAVRHSLSFDESVNAFEFKDNNTEFYCKYFE